MVTDIILETPKALLRPMSQNDFAALLEVAQDKDMWQYFTVNLSEPATLKKWINALLAEKGAQSRIPFTIIDKDSNRVAGSMSLLNISLHDLRVEIGSSWLGKDFRSTGLNRHAKFAMIRYAFETMGMERVEFKTDVLNERARKGLKNVGGIEEGVLRSHMTMWNNRRRSSIFYSILKDEWPKLKETIFKDLA
jgi:N-acetyltransferase